MRSLSILTLALAICSCTSSKGTYASISDGVLTFGNGSVEFRLPDKSAEGLAPCESAPYIDGELFPCPTGWAECNVLSTGRDSTVIMLEYPEWKAGRNTVGLYKEIRIFSHTDKILVRDSYFFDGPATLDFAQGFGNAPGGERYIRRGLAAIFRDGKALSVYTPHAFFSGYSADGSEIITVERAYSGNETSYLIEQRQCADKAAWKAYKQELDSYFND